MKKNENSFLKNLRYLCLVGVIALGLMTIVGSGGGGGGGGTGNGGTNGGSGTTATLDSIAVTPTNPSIAPENSQQFTATGTYSDGTTKDITNEVTWSSSDTSVATIDGSGYATAITAGTTTITATLGGVSGSTTLTVTSGETTSRGTIRIQSDDEFTSENGVMSGSGTQPDPYIIELWSIDASSCDTSVWPYIKVGIAIYDTEKYFVIRDCQVDNADEYGSGISLSFLSNGTVENCTLGNSGSGISLSGCDNVVISGNTIENCENGITNGSYSSDGITISDNTITGCTDTGIEFHYLTNSSCTGNNVSDNNQGIYVSALWFGGCTISNNTVQGNTLEGIDVTGDSEENTISNNDTSNNGGTGIAVYGSNNTISYNTSNENSGSGIKLDFTGLTDITASNNTVSNNTASSNGMDGIYVGSNCVNNTISDNTCLSNNALGWYYDDGTPWYYDININAQPNSLTSNNYGTIYIY